MERRKFLASVPVAAAVAASLPQQAAPVLSTNVLDAYLDGNAMPYYLAATAICEKYGIEIPQNYRDRFEGKR